MTDETVDKNTAIWNLPTITRRQHDRIELSGTGRNEIPVAQVKYTHRYDVLRDMDLFDDFHVALAQTFAEWQWNSARYLDARAHSLEGKGRHLSEMPEYMMNQRDCYMRLLIKLRRYDKNIISMVELVCAEVERTEDIGNLRSALFTFGQRILSAFDVLDRLMSEVQQEKRNQKERGAAQAEERSKTGLSAPNHSRAASRLKANENISNQSKVDINR